MASPIATYQVYSAAADTTTLTSPSFTPSNGEFLVVKLTTWGTADGMNAPSGGSQTYSITGPSAPGGFSGWCAIYTATVSGSPGSMTVSAAVATANATRHSMVVERWPVGSSLGGTVVADCGGVSSNQSASLTAAGTNSNASWCAVDELSLDPTSRTYLLSATEDGIYDGHVGSNSVQYFAYASLTTAGAYSVGMSAPANQRWNLVGLEVKAAAATATFVPQQPARHASRKLLPRLMRLRRPMPVPPQFNPLLVPAEIDQPRRVRGLLARRGHVVASVPPQVNPPIIPAEIDQPRRMHGWLMRRGRVFTGPVPVQVNPPIIPAEIDQPRRIRGLLPRRGRCSLVVPMQQGPVPSKGSTRWHRRHGRVSRAAIRSVWVVFAAPPTPSTIPTIQRPARIARSLPRFTGRRFAPPWGQASGPAFHVWVIRRPARLQLRWSAWVDSIPLWRVQGLASRWVAQLDPIPLWRVQSLSTRWSAQMTTKTIASTSTEFVQARIPAPVKNGVAVDPTSDAVKMAFIVGTALPGVSDWKSASWDNPGDGTYIAQCLVGPTGGTVTLTVATYQVWVQITDNPEQPVIPAGTLVVR